MNQENVLVVPTAGIQPFIPGPFCSSRLAEIRNYIVANSTFRSRAVVEEDESFKQIIPYVVIRHAGSYLLAQRTARQTESRLHGKFSLGIGGHINDCERCSHDHDIIRIGLERELAEEVQLLGSRRSLDLVGVILDGSTPVSRVHLGLVFVLETDTPDFTVKEPDLMTAEWADAERLQDRYPQMETWSQLVFQHVVAPAGVHPAQEAIHA